MNTVFSKVHYEKLVSAKASTKLNVEDIPRLDEAIKQYEQWITNMDSVEGETIEVIVREMVGLLNEYKTYIDLELIFDSEKDFLYRQKGQLKLDNTIIEEFLPLLVSKCITHVLKDTGEDLDIEINSQVKTFSNAYFTSNMKKNAIAGGFRIKNKDQDFSITRKLFIQASYSPEFEKKKSIIETTSIPYVVAECKTNLDKTMFQEATATAHDVKTSVRGGKYFLLCDYLDMTPVSTSTTEIDEIIILRKAKRISSNVRKSFSSREGRIASREMYKKYLEDNPYQEDTFMRFVNHIVAMLDDDAIDEDEVLTNGYF